MSKPDGSGGHEKPSLWTRARYRFDAILSHGTAGLFFLSLVGSALITLLLTPIFWFLEESPRARGNFVTLLSSSGRDSSDSLR